MTDAKVKSGSSEVDIPKPKGKNKRKITDVPDKSPIAEKKAKPCTSIGSDGDDVPMAIFKCHMCEVASTDSKNLEGPSPLGRYYCLAHAMMCDKAHCAAIVDAENERCPVHKSREKKRKDAIYCSGVLVDRPNGCRVWEHDCKEIPCPFLTNKDKATICPVPCNWNHTCLASECVEVAFGADVFCPYDHIAKRTRVRDRHECERETCNNKAAPDATQCYVCIWEAKAPDSDEMGDALLYAGIGREQQATMMNAPPVCTKGSYTAVWNWNCKCGEGKCVAPDTVNGDNLVHFHNGERIVRVCTKGSVSHIAREGLLTNWECKCGEGQCVAPLIGTTPKGLVVDIDLHNDKPMRCRGGRSLPGPSGHNLWQCVCRSACIPPKKDSRGRDITSSRAYYRNLGSDEEKKTKEESNESKAKKQCQLCAKPIEGLAADSPVEGKYYCMECYVFCAMPGCYSRFFRRVDNDFCMNHGLGRRCARSGCYHHARPGDFVCMGPCMNDDEERKQAKAIAPCPSCLRPFSHKHMSIGSRREINDANYCWSCWKFCDDDECSAAVLKNTHFCQQHLKR